jgi:sulfite reductase beta subunit-like hemoprotein
VIVPDLATAWEVDQDLARVGLSGDARSGWRHISACTGAPGCTGAAAPTRPVASYLAGQRESGTQLPIHVVACERRCGAPSADHLEVFVSTDSDEPQFSVSRPSAGSGDPGASKVVKGLAALVDAVAGAGESL